MIPLDRRHNLVLVFSFLVLFTSLSAAVSASFNQTTTTVRPGVNQTLGTLTLTGENSSVQIEDTTHNFPFPLYFTNATRNTTTSTANNTTQTNATLTTAIVIHPPGAAAPGDRSNTFYVILPRESITQPVAYTVEEVRNWTVTPRNITGNLSVDDTGLFGTVTVRQHGNADQTVSTNLTGNISELLSVDDEYELHPETPLPVRIGYDIPPSQQFGNYTGTLQLTGGNTTRVVNLSASVADDIRPEFVEEVAITEFMATTEPQISVVVHDNLAVESVVANVTREKTVQRGNTTVTINESVGAYALSSTPHSEQWTFTLADTDEITRYYINITATDTAGNTVSTVDGFKVTGLDAVQVVDPKFTYDAIRHKEKASELVIENKVESPFTLRLERFAYAGNTSVEVGILTPGASSPEYFDGENDTLQFSETGEYRLVVDSRQEEPVSGMYRFDGRISIQVPPQHYNVSNIVFDGQINSDDYPEPQRLAMREFRGAIGYGNIIEFFEEAYGPIGGEGSRKYVYYIGRMPASQCRNHDGWGTCSSWNIGANQRLEQQVQNVTAENKLLKLGIAAVILLAGTGLYVYRRLHRYRHLVRGYLPRKAQTDS